jgi:hypothetical protein
LRCLNPFRVERRFIGGNAPAYSGYPRLAGVNDGSQAVDPGNAGNIASTLRISGLPDAAAHNRMTTIPAR